jgi:hypothetical protein
MKSGKTYFTTNAQRAKPQPKKNERFTTETRSSQSSEYVLVKNFLLRVLSASAVHYPEPS